MEQGRIERDRIRLISSERLILELYLLAYPLFFITASSIVGDHYLWLLFSTLAGVITYIVFSKMEYSFGVTILLSALLSGTFILLGYPVLIVLLLFIYVFLRVKGNFGKTKSTGWPFLVLNTIMFTTFYLLTFLFFVHDDPKELAKVHITLYILTTVLYFVLRFMAVAVIGRHLRNFSIVDTGKIFGGLLSIGFLSFVGILFLFEPIRKGIIAVVGFLIGGLYMFVLEWIIAPIWELIVAGWDKAREERYEEPLVYFIDFSLQEERTVFGAGTSMPEILSIVFIVIVALIIFIILVRNRKKMNVSDSGSGYLFLSGRRNKNVQKNAQLVYDYSAAANTVRKAFKDFEQTAQSSSAPRLRGETVKEWFSRMGWVQNKAIFNTYDKVRYGSFGITEEESNHFSDELEKLKNNYFSKDV